MQFCDQKLARFKQPRRVDGPSLQAAFFRRSTLSTLGPLSGRFGSEHTETDLAARLRGMNQPCECIVESQVIGVSIERLRGFCSAQHSELLFWHHRRLTGRLTGLLSHGGHVSADLLLQMPFPSTITAALGRTVGAMRSVFSQPCTYEPVEEAVAGERLLVKVVQAHGRVALLSARAVYDVIV